MAYASAQKGMQEKCTSIHAPGCVGGCMNWVLANFVPTIDLLVTSEDDLLNYPDLHASAKTADHTQEYYLIYQVFNASLC